MLCLFFLIYWVIEGPLLQATHMHQDNINDIPILLGSRNLGIDKKGVLVSYKL